jgi:excisionase family DNA binding protein
VTEPLLTVAELAERLAVPTRTIYRLAAEGVPGFYRIRRTWRADPEAVLEALSNRPEVAAR